MENFKSEYVQHKEKEKGSEETCVVNAFFASVNDHFSYKHFVRLHLIAKHALPRRRVAARICPSSTVLLFYAAGITALLLH